MLLVTGHHGAVEWARRRGLVVEYVPHLDPARVAPGQIVIGTLPAHLAAEVCALGGRYYHLAMDIPADQRRRDYTPEEMDGFGARLMHLVVSLCEDDQITEMGR
jgi:CRISPR-associated protein Csx16